MPRFSISKNKKNKDLTLEESLGEKWSRDLDVVEVPIGNWPFFIVGALVLSVGAVFALRVLYLNLFLGESYKTRAEANETQIQRRPAPRGIIYDRNGTQLTENEVVFSAVLNTKEFLRNSELQDKTLQEIKNILYVEPENVWLLIKESAGSDFILPVVLVDDLTHGQIVALESLGLPTMSVEKTFKRIYREGNIFSSATGYVGRASANDLKINPLIGANDLVGKSGVEMYYDGKLQGQAGITKGLRNAKGKVLNEKIEAEPKIGESLKLTVDGGFQEYFYSRLLQGLNSLGKKIGVGIALNPRNGEILALVNFPGFNSNLLSGSGNNEAKTFVLTSKDKPLFDRAVSGMYTPGSTIKPLVAVAALKEKVIDTKRKLFSPGYIDIPNPYDPETPTKYKDWRYQGRVDVYDALAQSSNVYFYIAGGGAPNGVDPEILNGGGYVSGLGINRLRSWWEKFLLGNKTGVDLPGESEGFLPSPTWKEKTTGQPWRLGDTYNVSIGQGDLLLTPIQLISYIAAIANGGKIFRPMINLERGHEIAADLSNLLPEIKEVQKGMERTVTSPMGTARLLNDLGFRIAAKTGTAEVRSKQGENAFFVGYAPTDNPQIAILILVENSLEGSLNTVPIAKDVLDWYYWNRIFPNTK